MTAAEAARLKIEGIDRIPDEWVKKVMRFQPSMAAQMRRLLSRITVDSAGIIEPTSANLARVDELLTAMQRWLTQSEYLEFVGQLSNEMVGQQTATVTYFTEAFGEAPVSTFASAVYNTGRAQLIADIIPEGLSYPLWKPLRDTMTNGIATGAGYADLLEEVTAIIQGGEGQEGAILRYSRVIVADTIAATDASFTDIIATDLGLEWYKYTGGKMDTTRCFCLKRNGKFYHRKEVEAWGNGHDVGSCGFPWAGMRKGTDGKTIFAYRGGYNCQHSLLPVSEFSVPKEDALRAVAKGYYKPTKTAQDYFGLT